MVLHTRSDIHVRVLVLADRVNLTIVIFYCYQCMDVYTDYIYIRQKYLTLSHLPPLDIKLPVLYFVIYMHATALFSM